MSETPDHDGTSSDDKPRSRLIAFLPLAAFLLIGLVFLAALLSDRDPQALPSALIGSPAPETTLPPLEGIGLAGLTPADLRGQVSVINVWASWCGPCRLEHPLLMQLASDRPELRFIGINYKDAPENARRFLGQLGNPFDIVGTDVTGRAVIDWGVYGVPETYVVDAHGIIRFKFVGPLSEQGIANFLMPAIEAALAGPAS